MAPAPPHGAAPATRVAALATEKATDKPHRGPFVPIFFALLAMLLWFAAHAWDQVQQRGVLQKAIASQQATVDNATKLRGGLDALAADTQRLAAAGNPNAALLVDELRKRGVTINLPAAGGGTAASAPR
jgi:hypothetical protein